MEWLTQDVLAWIAQFALILIRLAALFTISPIFGRSNLPALMKVGFSVILSVIVVMLFPPAAAALSPTLPAFVLMALGELAVGLSLGFLTTLFFSVVMTAGQVIDTQVGFGMSQVYDAQSNIQVPVTGTLFNIMLLLSAMVTDGHLRLVRILTNTFDYIPVGQASLSIQTSTVVLDAFVKSFVLAVQVALPVIASGLLAEIALGVIVRTAPQMNVFVIGIPLKIIIGLVVLLLIVPVFAAFTTVIFDAMYSSIDEVMLTFVR